MRSILSLGATCGLGLSMILGCQSWQLSSWHQAANASDFDYRRGFVHDENADAPHLVAAYRRLGAVLFSECKNLPSDSEFATLMGRCSQLHAIPDAVSRMLLESDLPESSSHDPIVYKGRLRWVDPAPVCSIH